MILMEEASGACSQQGADDDEMTPGHGWVCNTNAAQKAMTTAFHAVVPTLRYLFAKALCDQLSPDVIRYI
jgi:hypothetical protein